MSYSPQSGRVSSPNVGPSTHFPDIDAQRVSSSDFGITRLLAQMSRKRARRVYKEAKKIRRRHFAASHKSTDALVITLSDSEEDDSEIIGTLPPKQPTRGRTTSAENGTFIQGEESPSHPNDSSFISNSSEASMNVDDAALPRRRRQTTQSRFEQLVDKLMDDILWPKNI